MSEHCHSYDDIGDRSGIVQDWVTLLKLFDLFKQLNLMLADHLKWTNHAKPTP